MEKMVSILYADGGQGPEWCDLYAAEALREKGHSVEFIDVSGRRLPDGDIILNRVYPSMTSGNGLAADTLRVLECMESEGRKTVNTASSSTYGYDKYLAHQKLWSSGGIQTPKTYLIEDLESAMYACEELGFPAVLKRNTGGGSVRLLKEQEEAGRYLKGLIGHTNGYQGKYILQKFVEPVEPYDIRISIVDGEPRTAVKSALKGADAENPWRSMADSDISRYDSRWEEYDLAFNAAAALGAYVDTVEMRFGPTGAVVIGNDLTPRPENNRRGARQIRDMLKVIG